MQGFQLSRIERESPAWTLFLPLSRQACKISRIIEKNPAKHVGKKPYKIITFQIFTDKEACNPPKNHHDHNILANLD